MINEELRARVAAWLADDPDEQDRHELAGLLADGGADAAAELEDRFARRLRFGTAGLRGAVAAGPNRMNRATVTATTAALAGWLLGRYPAASTEGVVIGCDARYRSEDFALQAALVLAGAGIRVHLLPSRQPTPLIAYAVRYLHAAAGVMITASHNPAGDNGYKVYLRDGAQIAPPADIEIEAAIDGLGPLSAIKVAAPDSPLIVQRGDDVTQAYLNDICAALGEFADSGASYSRRRPGDNNNCFSFHHLLLNNLANFVGGNRQRDLAAVGLALS